MNDSSKDAEFAYSVQRQDRSISTYSFKQHKNVRLLQDKQFVVDDKIQYK